jgi:hypothetical protein
MFSEQADLQVEVSAPVSLSTHAVLTDKNGDRQQYALS